MTAFGYISILISFSAIFFVKNPNKIHNISLFLSLITIHIISSFVYYNIELNNISDSYMYFSNNRNFRFEEIKFGSEFIAYFIQTMKASIGGEFLDYFLFFQIFGFFGIVLLWRSFQELLPEDHDGLFALPIPLLFLPGLHFWTSAIGKDGIVMFGACLCIWATININRRSMAFLVGIFFIFIVRQHIAVMAILAFLMAIVFSSGMRSYVKVGLLISGVICLVFLLPYVQAKLQLQELNLDSLTDFVSSRQELGLRNNASAAIVSLPLPLRALSLLFQPIFFDAVGLLAYIASVESLILLTVIGYLIVSFRALVEAALQNFVVMFCVWYTSCVVLALSIVHYNVGLGLRQKMMAVPGILIMLLAVRVWHRLGEARSGAQHNMSMQTYAGSQTVFINNTTHQ